MPRGHALIVDDSSTARIILARLLERADISTKGVPSAEDALKRLQNEQFDLIFLDHLLPGMDGFQALEAIKSQPETRDIPVFMYTSQSAEKYLQEAKAKGAAGVIGKQVDRDKLFRTLESILTGQSVDSKDQEWEWVSESHSLQTAADLSHTRRITGRLSTLEIAYEEAYDELRHLKQALIRLEAIDLEGLELRHRRMKHLWLATLAVFTVVTVVLGLQVNALSGVIEGVNGQLVVMQEMLGSLIEFVGR